MRKHPLLYQVNTLPFLRRLAEEKKGGPGGAAGTERRDTEGAASARAAGALDEVPEETWRTLAGLGMDLVWLMGVWRRSPRGREIALADAGLRRAYDEALPGWREEDVAGSPYAVHAYQPDPSVGDAGVLARVRQRLQRHGMGLVLDFVPNHLALDHLWTRTHPLRFVGRARSAGEETPPQGFFLPAGSDGRRWIAHGRDPYFPPWTDTAQVNVFAADLRRAHAAQLLRIAEVADGVRCDMAMLALHDVFARVWGSEVEERAPAGEFWQETIDLVKARHPGFLFLAEAYWETEETLLRLGFDYVYDKGLYDRLRQGGAAEVRAHLARRAFDPACAAHFIENHDEERAVRAFGPERARAAAVVAATLPGMRFFHDGQLEGRAARLPVQLSRAPRETPQEDLRRFYRELLAALRRPVFHDGEWRPRAVEPAGDASHEHLLAWSWQLAGSAPETALVVVNLSGGAARGRVFLDAAGADPAWRDRLTAGAGTRTRVQRYAEVELDAWGSQIVAAERAGNG